MTAPAARARRAAALALALGAASPPTPAAAPEPPAAPGGYGTVAYAHLEGPIDRIRDRYLERTLEQARAHGADTVLVHIATDGGAVHYAREMFKRVLDQAGDGPRMIAYVDDRALSAGALIAYAHEGIWVSETASIGDIGVVYRSAEGGIEYAPEKIETVIRTLLAQAAEQRGWPRALLLKMTARNQALYRITRPDGAVDYVIEDDLPDYLSRHPGIDRDDEQRVVLLSGEDRLLTLTGLEAIEHGMATGLARDLPALYARLGIDPAAVLDLAPTALERTAAWLAGVAPLLAGLAMLLVLFELKTPGIGLWAALAAACGAAFLLAQYALDLAAHFEVVLIAAGMALLAADVVLGAGAGMLAIAGGVLAFAGLVLTFVPNEFEWDLSDPRFLDALADAALSSLASVGIVVAGIVGFVTLMPRTRLRHRLALEAAVTGTSADGAGLGPGLVGRTGVAREALHPGGSVEVDGAVIGARAEHGSWIAAGARVEIVAVEFGEVVVRASPGAAAPGAAAPGDAAPGDRG